MQARPLPHERTASWLLTSEQESVASSERKDAELAAAAARETALRGDLGAANAHLTEHLSMARMREEYLTSQVTLVEQTLSCVRGEHADVARQLEAAQARAAEAEAQLAAER